MSVSAGVIQLSLHPSGKHIVCSSIFFWSRLVLFCLEKKSFAHYMLFYYNMCVCNFITRAENAKKSILCCIALNPRFVPSSLHHLLFLTFSPPSLWIPQPHHNTVNRRGPDRFTAIVFPLAASLTAKI